MPYYDNFWHKDAQEIENTEYQVYHRPITGHHFSHVHATFWLRIEQCSNRRRNLIPEESGPRYVQHMYQKSALEKWSRFTAPVFGKPS